MKLKITKPKIKGDKIIWIVYLVLSVLSLIFVFSSMGKRVYLVNGDISGMFIKQLFIILGGILVVYVFHRIKYTIYAPLTKIGFALSAGVLGLTLVMGELFGKAANRWLVVIPNLVQFQPSEIVKYVLIIYVAFQLSQLKNKIQQKDEFRKLMLKIIVICGLIVLENFSTAFIILLACFLLLFIAGAKLKHLGMVILIGICVVIGFWGLSQMDIELGRNFTWTSRIENFVNNDPNEDNQYNSAIMAIATGGLSGVGIGNTVQGRFLSESHNDFIFAVILEEGGILICLIILFVYFVLFYRCMKLAKEAKGLFGTYISLGISFVLMVQTLVNMFVAVGLMPITGQTLPFLSYGGTSFMISSAAIGIILNISAEADKAKQEKLQQEAIDENSQIDNTNNQEI